MQINSLTLTNFRGYEQAQLEFKPGVNIIAGVNGAGKSSLLDALRILLSDALPGVTKCRATNIPIRTSDIRTGQTASDLSVNFDILDSQPSKEQYEYLLHFNREKFTEGTLGEVREQTRDTPDRSEFTRHGQLFWLRRYFPLSFSFRRTVR